MNIYSPSNNLDNVMKEIKKKSCIKMRLRIKNICILKSQELKLDKIIFRETKTEF